MTSKLVLAAALLAPAACLADSPDTKTPSPAEATVAAPLPPAWSGDAALGYIRTTGDTDSTALNFKASLDYKSAPWENQFQTLGAYGDSKSESTAESYQFGDKLNYDLNPDSYVFGSLSYANDRFAGVVSRWSEAVGYGRHLIKTPEQTLDADIGAGASESRNNMATRYDRQLIGVFNAQYLYKITAATQFKQTLHVEGGSGDIFINPVSELKLTVVGNLFATLGYDWRHNTSVPAGSVHTDTITTVNFGYTFGKKPS
jgi:putative salt-induced outer membrane protein